MISAAVVVPDPWLPRRRRFAPLIMFCLIGVTFSSRIVQHVSFLLLSEIYKSMAISTISFDGVFLFLFRIQMFIIHHQHNQIMVGKWIDPFVCRLV